MFLFFPPIFINDLNKKIISLKFHFNADDTIIYSLSQAITILQNSFYIFHHNLLKLKLFLNVHKTKYTVLFLHVDVL